MFCTSSSVYNPTGGHFVLTFVNNTKTKVATGFKLQVCNGWTMGNFAYGFCLNRGRFDFNDYKVITPEPFTVWLKILHGFKK